MVKYKTINHVGLVTSKMDETIRFWRDLLGMRLVVGSGKKGYKQYFFQVSGQNLLSFFEWSEVSPIEEKDAGRPAKGQIAFDHICIEVENKKDLWALQDKLEAADIWTTVVIDSGIVHSFFTFDPNGIALEICYSVDEVDVIKNPIMVDRDPSEIALEGPEPQTDKWPAVETHTPEEKHKVYEGDVSNILKEKNRWE